MSLQDIYDNIEDPKAAFRENLMQACDVGQATVYRWLKGKVEPTKLQKAAIAKATGFPLDELFPKTKEVEEAGHV